MKKITIITIILIFILNILIPTIALAKENSEDRNILNEKEEVNTINENKMILNNITDENDTNMPVIENDNTAVETDTNKSTVEDNNIIIQSDNQSIRRQQIDIKTEEIKSMLYVDTPSGNTYYRTETDTISISGWKMANVSDTYIKAYLDGKEIDTIEYAERADVIASVTEYGSAEQNPTPGFGIKIETSKLSGGMHKVRIESCYGDEVLETAEVTFNYDTKIKSMLYVDTPSGNTYYRTETDTISVSGWKMANVSDTYIKAYLDGKEIDTIEYAERADVIASVTEYGSAEQNPTPGFGIKIETSKLSGGMHKVRIESCYGDEVLETAEVTFNYDTKIKSMLYVDTPSGNTYYREDKISISGWKMANVSDTYIKAYLDGKEIDTIEYAERADVIASVTEYGSAEQNPTPGFGIKIETSKLSGGMHKVRIESCYGDEVLETAEVTFNYDTKIKSMLYVDTPSGNTYYREDKINISGWKMANVSDTYIKAYLDGEEVDSIEYAERADVIASVTEYGSAEQNPTPGFGIKIETNQLSGGMHKVRIESCYGDEILETAEVTFNYDTGIKSMLYIDTPSGNTYYREDKINISGWKMANVSDTYIKAYLDGEEVDSIEYAERADVIASVTEYGSAEQNPTPGFGIKIDTSKLSGGMHKVRIESCYGDEILETAEVTFNYDTEIKSMLYVDTPSGNTYYRTKTDMISVSGWKMANVSDTYIKAYLDGEEIDSIEYAERQDVIASVTEYGSAEQNPTPGFGIKIETNQLSGGMHKVRIESCYGDEVLEIAEVTFNYDTEIKSMLYVDTPSGNTYYRTETGKISVSGWKMANMSDTYIKAYLDNKEITSIEYTERADVIASVTEYGSAEQNPTPGFKIEIETGQLSGGVHEVRIESCYRDEVLETANITFNIVTSFDFSQLDESKYPGYKEALQSLQKQHPNWIIKIDYTGLDWNAVLDGEYSLTSTGSARSLTQEKGAWRADKNYTI